VLLEHIWDKQFVCLVVYFESYWNKCEVDTIFAYKISTLPFWLSSNSWKCAASRLLDHCLIAQNTLWFPHHGHHLICTKWSIWCCDKKHTLNFNYMKCVFSYRANCLQDLWLYTTNQLFMYRKWFRCEEIGVRSRELFLCCVRVSCVLTVFDITFSSPRSCRLKWLYALSFDSTTCVTTWIKTDDL